VIVEEANSFLEPASTRVRDPLSGRSVWLAGMVKDARIESELLKYTLEFKPGHSPQDRQGIQAAIQANLEGLGWSGEVVCNARLLKGDPTNPAEPVRGMASRGGVQPHGGPIEKKDIEGVTHIVAVASGKGGVGKSTVAVNLACALAADGHRVGLMDADIYGPSVPLMMKVNSKPLISEDRRILPLVSYGVKCMSIGFLVDSTEPIIWRGPMVMGVVRQFLQDVAWAPLDYLIVDLPPGTGDAQLTMIQAVHIAGAVIVSTPQDVALLDAVRGLEMFRKLEVPVLGVVENMAWYALPDGEKAWPFGNAGAVRMAKEKGIDLLAQVPLQDAIRAGGDEGSPLVLEEGKGEAFRTLAIAVAERLPA
jgi:ATP-binding protein involved in chromosome partitioning